ncbi:acyl-homoserine-lactone synthase [Granulosicoccus sp. 3-233]|uniref:acyl-homoserine-lactone synthase n=1 Tax=Granulosicoccus sp. 3-233 TaxID=3417969 RepID=UPI003D331505
MRQLILGTREHPALNQSVLTRMHRLRHRVFRERLRWNVGSDNGVEVDDFDALDPYYMVALEDGEATACWRLLPTTGPYMLRNTFQQLLRGEPLPEQRDIWELSRFAVLSPAQRFKGQIHLNDVAFEMFDRLIQFADERRIRQYVTVVSTSVERLMKSNGISLRRFGDGQASDVDGIRSVACWVTLDQRTRASVSNAVVDTRTA